MAGTSAMERAISATITEAGRSASEQCEWPVRSEACRRDAGWPTGLVPPDAGRASGLAIGRLQDPDSHLRAVLEA